MKNYLIYLTIALFSIFSHNSFADNNIYVGAAAGVSAYDYEDIDPATATKFLVGARLSDTIAMEITLYDSGDADITSFSGLTLTTDGINLSVLYVLGASNSKLRAHVGAGVYNFDTTLEGPGGSTSESGSGLSLAAGLSYDVTQNFALRADADLFAGVKDFADNQPLRSLHIGVVFTF